MSQPQAQPPLRLNVLVVFFAYGGNGGVAMQLPAIGQWWARTLQTALNDPRVGEIKCFTLSDTPITMTRNRAVKMARDNNFQVLVMVDSDNEPDIYADSGAKRFWDSSFDFVYERYKIGLPTVIAAPYCGPPPHPTEGGMENVYVFRWENSESTGDHDCGYKLVAYSRGEASQLAGIHPAGALPTGLMMSTISAFNLVNPDGNPKPYFYYEFDEWQATKCSTEDVTATRDISIAANLLLGEEVVFCNWDCWAGHHKPKCVGKPEIPSSHRVGKGLEASIAWGLDPEKRFNYLAQNFPHFRPRMTPNQAMAVQAKLANTTTAATPQVEAEKPIVPTEFGTVILNGSKVWVGNGAPDEEIKDSLYKLAHVTKSLAMKRRRPLRVIDVNSRAAETAVAVTQGFSGSYGGQVFSFANEFPEWATTNTSEIGSIKLVEDPITSLNELEPQGADIVVVSGTESPEILKLVSRHVSGTGLLCGFRTAMPEGATDNGDGIWTIKGGLG